VTQALLAANDAQDPDPIRRGLGNSNITAAGLRIIDRVRASTRPERRVRGSRNIVVRFTSLVMRTVLTLESGFEAAVALLLDCELKTRELYDQPCRLSFTLADADRSLVIETVPDLLQLYDAGVDPSGHDVIVGRLIEAKHWADMEKLSRADGERYALGADGRWHDRYVETYVTEQLGMEYTIVSDPDVPTIVVENEAHLRDLSAAPLDVPADFQAGLRAAVRARPGESATRMLERVPGLSPRMFDQMLVDGDGVWVARDRERIRELEQLHVFPDGALGLAILAQPVRPADTSELDLSIGAQFKWGERLFLILNVRGDAIDCFVEGVMLPPLSAKDLMTKFRHGEITGQARPANPGDALANGSEKVRARFLKRQARIDRARATGTVDRTTKRLTRESERLTQLEGHGVRAIVPNFANCGRHGSRIKPRDRALAWEVIETQYLTPVQRSLRFAHAAYRLRYRDEIAPARGGAPMSWPTFRQLLVNNWTREEIDRARKGERAANAAAMRSPLGGGLGAYQGIARAPHAWRLAHTDDTELDCWGVDSVTGATVGRIWLSLSVDDYSGKSLAFCLSYFDPSKVSTMEVKRRVAEKYGRLFEEEITDNAKYFGSTVNQVFCANHGITLRRRPPAHGRYGSRVEVTFRRLNRLLHALEGSNLPNQDPRSLDRDLAPQKRAKYTLSQWEEIIESGLRILDGEVDPITGKSAQQRFDESVARMGTAPVRQLRVDQTFMILTAIPHGPIQVDGQGINVGGINFWCEAFRSAPVQGTKVQVLDEPRDPSIKYAFVENAWHVCTNERFPQLQHLSPRELANAAQEFEKRRLGRPATADELVEYALQLQSLDQRKAAEGRTVTRPVPRVSDHDAAPDLFAQAATDLAQVEPNPDQEPADQEDVA
jgi:hypothetical protein